MLNTLEYIKQLSLTDEKTLSGKVLKGVEELGELAKQVLPYEQQFATTHRFPDKARILEEACDTILCALSVPFSLGFSIDDIEEMMKTKADKWAGLQEHSISGRFPLPFEIHVTVLNADVEAFKNICKVLEVKPIVLDLQIGSTENEVMTSSVVVTDNLGAITDMQRISKGLTEAGFTVCREKVETVPWHPAAMSDGKGYFESHLNIKVYSSMDADRLQGIADSFGGHLSKNKFKACKDYYHQMITLRSHTLSRAQFTDEVEDMASTIESSTSCSIEKIGIEYAVYDSKESHDITWLTKK